MIVPPRVVICPHCAKALRKVDARAPWPVRRRLTMVLDAHRAGACVAPVVRDPYADEWEAAR